MAQLTEADHDLETDLVDQPLLIAPHSRHCDLAALEALMQRGLVMTPHSRQGGTIYGITWAGRRAIADE